MNRTWVVVGVMTLSTVAVGKPVHGVTDKEVKLGATQPLTGPIAFYGEMSKGSKALFQKINDAGGINGRKINYIVEDDQYSPAKTVPETRKLVERDGVFAMFQPLGFPHTAVADYLKQKGVADFFISDGSQLWEKYPNVFYGMVPWRNDGEALGRYVAEKMPGKTVGFLYENSNFGHEGLEGAKEALKGKVKFGPEQSYEPGSAEADAQTLNLMNAKVDVVIALVVTNIAAGSVKTAAQKGWKPQWLISYVNASPEAIGLGGAAMEGVISSVFLKLPTDDDPAVKAHQALLDKYFPGTKASVITIYGAADAELMVETLRRAGKALTPQSAIAAAEGFHDFKCSLCQFPVSTSKTDHKPFKQLRFMQVRGGKWALLQ